MIVWAAPVAAQDIFVLGEVHDNADALRTKDIHECLGDLIGQTFLDLQASGKQIG